MTVNNVEIAYEFHGPADGPVIAMVQGLSMPLNAWPPAMIERLTAAGYRILTFDNRDIGESQTFDRHGVPNLAWAWFKSQLRLPINPPYTLHDMAADVAALLARLDIRRAHILGVSMGGMIAQRMAIDHPARCASLTLDHEPSFLCTRFDEHVAAQHVDPSRAVIEAAPKDPRAAAARRLIESLGDGG